MGKIKLLILTLLLMIATFLNGCGGNDKTEQFTEAETSMSGEVLTDEEESEQEIPEELLPQKDSNSSTSVEAETEGKNSSKEMVIMGEDDTVYETKSYSANKKSDTNTSSDKKNQSSEAVEEVQEKKTINIGFSIESSQADGTVSYDASMTLDKGATVYDALSASGISYSGKSYISSIGGLSEGMFGSQSGWKYYVNGVAPNKSCVNYVLKDGDRVQWKYVLKP
ncbi:MAG: DUF4430 domain-containing protein [Dorea sp.]